VIKYILQRELRQLEYKVQRHYVLSGLIVDLEKPASNIVTKFFNWYQSNHVNQEYKVLTDKMPMIQARIEEIKEL